MKRIYKNKIRQLTFKIGAHSVQLAATGKVLWLVTVKQRNRGYSWFLCYFKNCTSAQAAVELAFHGYGWPSHFSMPVWKNWRKKLLIIPALV